MTADSVSDSRDTQQTSQATHTPKLVRRGHAPQFAQEFNSP